MRICALDLSLKASGYAIAIDGNLEDHGLILGRGDELKRLIWNRDKVMKIVDEVKPELVVFEDFSFGSDLSYVREIAGMSYMIRAELDYDKIPFVAVSPMSLKKFVVGTAGSAKNKVTKDLVIKCLLRDFGHDVDDNNRADAIGLAYVGMGAVGDWEPRTKAQGEVLATVHKNHPWLKQMSKPVQALAGENPLTDKLPV